MRSFTLSALAVGCLLQDSHAAVQLSFSKQKSEGRGRVSASAPRSDSANLDSAFSYQGATYVVNVTVGTPGQPVSLQLSTTASNTFVIDARSEWCAYDQYATTSDSSDSYDYLYCPWGTFANNVSTTFECLSTSDDYEYYSESDFYESYDGKYAYGGYMNDVLTVDGVTVSNLTMGLVNSTSGLTYAMMGVLGIGYNDSSYDNLPNRLQQDGRINSTAYSIWLDDDTASTGNLLFGAVDTGKFVGNLTRLVSAYSYSSMEVYVTSINGSTSKSADPIIITSTSDSESDSDYYSSSDSSSDDYLFTADYSPADTVSVLPNDLASQIWQIAGAYFDESAGLALVSCSAANDKTNFTIQLGGRGSKGPVITALMSDLVIPADELNVTDIYYAEDNVNACMFGVQNSSTPSYSYSSTGSYSLGNTLLRRTYSVFDLVNNEVAVAPVNPDATSTSVIVPFESYGAVVPSSTILCLYSGCFSGSDSGSGSGSDGDSDESSESGLPAGLLPVGALVGMSLGIGLGCVALGLAGFLLRRHRRNRQPASKEAASASSVEAGDRSQGPVMSSAAAASAAPPAMSEAPRAPAAVEGKGKAPEIPEPVAGSSSGVAHSASEATGSHNVGHLQQGEASSSRNV